jgi:hypothetical protein
MNRKIAVIVSAAALAGGAGIAVAAGGDSATTGGGDTPTMSRPGGGFDHSALAEKLGVTETELQQAMESARSTGGPPDPSRMAQALADELGLSLDEVQAALEETMPQRGGPGGPPPDGATSQS